MARLSLPALRHFAPALGQGLIGYWLAPDACCGRDRLQAGMMELGLGIHGEPGAWQEKLQPPSQVVAEVGNFATHPAGT